MPGRGRGRLKGGAHVTGELLVHQASLLQHSGISSAEVGGFRGNGQHEELRGESTGPGSDHGVLDSPTGSGCSGRTRSFRRRDAPRSIPGGRIGTEALVLPLLCHGEKAPRRCDRGMGVSDRGLERPFLRKEALTHGDEALQLLTVLVRHPPSLQDEGERRGAGSGQRRPQLADAPREQALPCEDGVVLRQAPQGLEPVFQLSQSGINSGPHWRVSAASDGSIIVADLLIVAGKVFGIVMQRGISIASITVRRTVTVDADGMDT